MTEPSNRIRFAITPAFLTPVLCLAQFCLAGSFCNGSDEIPGAPQRKPIALINGVIHPISGPPINEGTLIFVDGRISEIGTRMKPPSGSDIIDLKGQHVYPGMIEAHSTLGLTEIGSVRATHDFAETGSLNPNVRANVSVNPDSELIPVTRANGVLIALSAPSGGLISGQASVMQLDGWTYEQMTLKAAAAMVVNWPIMTPASMRGAGPDADQQNQTRNSQLTRIRELFEEARAWRIARKANPTGSAADGQAYDIRLDSMGPVLDRTIPLLVVADRADQIQSAVAFAAEQNVRLVIFGGADAAECAELLKQYDVPVIVEAVHKTPLRRHEDYDAAYTLPSRLRAAGIRFCISGSGRSESWNCRNLPYHAATAVAYGLPYEDAVRAVTIFPAQILGIEDRVGSL
ncbi:MAG: hypothetical protein KDA96_18935, partial [Planctomycetaceae bacterium]|nr:hypothetical protein [Planctomycetaceae bacterium]